MQQDVWCYDILTPISQDAEDMTKPEERIGILEERATWHRNIGWGAVGVFGALFVLLLTWYIPKELATLRESVKADGAAQLEPIKEQLVELNTIIKLRQTKDIASVLKESLDSALDPKLKVKAVVVATEEARSTGLTTNPQILVKADQQLQELGKNNPNIQAVAWAARLELVGYRTALNVTLGKTSEPIPVFKFPGTVIDGGSITNGTQALDGVYWINYTFRNARIIYNGGPTALQNVVFINCTFIMPMSPNASKLANTVLADNFVTGNFGGRTG
jgi:hypothetical protein